MPDCSFKICEKPSKFSRKCPRSYCHVRVVNGYADTASIYLLFPWHRSLQFFVFVNYFLGFERLWKWFNLVILLFVKLNISEYRFHNSYQKYKQTSLLAYVETSTSAMLMQQIQLMISELVAAMLVSWCLAGWSNIILQHLSRIISKRVIHRRATFTQSQKSLQGFEMCLNLVLCRHVSPAPLNSSLGWSRWARSHPIHPYTDRQPPHPLSPCGTVIRTVVFILKKLHLFFGQ